MKYGVILAPLLLYTGCGNRAKTSSTAVKRHCAYATNAGFFDTHNGRCVGNLIIDSAVQNVTKYSFPKATLRFLFLCLYS